MGILTHDEILKLHAAIVSAQLVASRSALLAGIDAHFVAGLPHGATPSDEILEHLNAMNEAGTLADGSMPLAIWLANAIARAGGKKEAAILRRAREQCETSSHGARSAARKSSPVPVAPPRLPLTTSSGRPAAKRTQPAMASVTTASLEKKYNEAIKECQKVKATIRRYKWPIVRALVELSVFRDDSAHGPANRRIPMADLVIELERTPESIDDYLGELSALGYLDIDEDGVRLDGHATCFGQLARSVVRELVRANSDDGRAPELFDALLR